MDQRNTLLSEDSTCKRNRATSRLKENLEIAVFCVGSETFLPKSHLFSLSSALFSSHLTVVLALQKEPSLSD